MRRIPVGDFATTPKMRTYITDVLDSEQISYGKYSRRFEQEFAALHGCQYGILSNSGTSALQVALQAMKEIHGWRDGSQVIVPVTTFIATANIVRHCRLVPVFCDVDPLTYNLDPRKLAPLLSKEVKAIIPVHLLGQPADVQGIRQVVAQAGYDLKIIEDSCECMFATHHGQPVGSLGDIGCFSTYNAHVLTTGVGGLSTTNNPAYAAKMRSLVNHGLQLDQLNPDENFSPRPMTGRRFQFETYGHSYRITEFEAALGVAQLEDWQMIFKRRNQNAARYLHRLKGLDSLEFQVLQDNNTHCYMMFGIVVEGDKTPLMTYLNQHDIETRDIPSCLGHPIYSWLNPGDFPISQNLYTSGFYVGCGPSLSHEEVDYVADIIIGFHENG